MIIRIRRQRGHCLLPYGLVRSVGIATSYELDGRGSIPGKGKRFFSTPQLSDRLLGVPSLLQNCVGGSFPGGIAAVA
jgi:hypothetical protein